MKAYIMLYMLHILQPIWIAINIIYANNNGWTYVQCLLAVDCHKSSLPIYLLSTKKIAVVASPLAQQN